MTRAAILALACWAAFNWVSTIHRITQLYVDLPTWDYWRVPAEAAEIRHLDPRFLWRQHNEHRIIFPDLVFALDVLLVHGRRILPLVVSFLCYAGSWAILAWLIGRETSIARATRVSIVLATAVLIGWKGCTGVLADPFLLQWTLLELAVLASLTFATRVPGTPGRWPVIGTIAWGIVATYSSANGLLLWAVLLIAAYLLRFSRKQIALLALAGIVADGLYFIGYRFSGGTNLWQLVLHPFYAACFVAVYLSMPFGGMKSPQFGVYVGFANLCLTAFLFSVAFRRGLVRTRPGIVLFGSYGFTLITAVLTAAGRMDVSDFYFSGAKATRYVAPLIVNWAVFVAIAMWMAALGRWRKFLVPVLLAGTAFLLAISFLKLRWWLEQSTRAFVDEQVTELSIENGVTDRRLLRSVFPDPGFVTKYLPALASHHESIFYENRANWLGKALAELGPPSEAVATGGVTTIFPVVSGVEVAGWANTGTGSPFERLVLADERGTIIGLGRRPADGIPSQLLSNATPARWAWIAFAPARYGAGKFSVYGIEPGTKKLRRIAGSWNFPLITAVNKSDLGPGLNGLTWRADPGWTRNGAGPHDAKQPAPEGLQFGTWNGFDSHTGQIAFSPFPVPASGCLILPVLHGPSTDGLSVELQDNASGQVIESMPMQNEDVQWEFWRVTATPGREVAEVARDYGKGAGQWLAIAAPVNCR